MPYLTGAEVLQELNADSDLCRIPVLHWSSAADAHVDDAFRNRVCARKPSDLDEYLVALQTVCGLMPALR
jgi:hypothetical protein